MSDNEKKGAFRILITGLLVLTLMSCFTYAVIFKNVLAFVGIIASLELLILFLYYTNNPLITNDKYETIYNKIIYKMPNYKANLGIGYSLIGLLINIFIFIGITQDKSIKYIGVNNYIYIRGFFSFMIMFWIFKVSLNATKLKHNEIGLVQMSDIFNSYFNFNNVDNETKIEEINSLKYEIQFKENSIFELAVNMFKMILSIIGLIGVTTVIKNFSIVNTAVIVVFSIMFILLNYSFKNLQKTKRQILYVLDMDIEKLKNQEEKQQNKVNKITKRRTRRKPNKNNVNGA